LRRRPRPKLGCGAKERRRRRNGTVAGSYEHGSETLDSIKGGEFLDWLSNYY
jgi:hypothetical protein